MNCDEVKFLDYDIQNIQIFPISKTESILLATHEYSYVAMKGLNIVLKEQRLKHERNYLVPLPTP